MWRAALALARTLLLLYIVATTAVGVFVFVRDMAFWRPTHRSSDPYDPHFVVSQFTIHVPLQVLYLALQLYTVQVIQTYPTAGRKAGCGALAAALSK